MVRKQNRRRNRAQLGIIPVTDQPKGKILPTHHARHPDITLLRAMVTFPRSVVGNAQRAPYLKANAMKGTNVTVFKPLAWTAAALMAAPAPTFADGHAGPVDILFATMELPAMLDLMRQEGLEYGQTIGQDLFQGSVSADWTATVERIYDADRMKSQVLDVLKTELDGDDVAAMVDFFASDAGTRIINLEVAARSALMDDAVEEAANEVAALAMADETPRFKKIEEFAELNDLIETNIVGAMNSNYAFFTGLADSGAAPQGMSEDEILADVWSQEPEIRQSTTEWVFSFLMLAYEPLDDADLDAYIAFSATDAGQDLNSALFLAFDKVYEGISRNLGLSAGQFMGQQEL